ncbi:MAG TPA: hypothetical protein VI434_06135 [Candidatus Dormibacteraeota bacterium]
MAYSERTDDEALSAGSQRPASRRWLIVAAAVIPVVLGGLATVVLYATHPAPPALPAVPTSAPPPGDVTVHDGGTIIIQPGTTNQVRVALGSVVEIVLQTGPGQMVTSEVPGILTPIPNPPCATATHDLCGLPGTQAWTFSAAHQGVTYLKISFGRHCSATTGACDSIHTVLLKPFSVYSRPQAQ